MVKVIKLKIGKRTVRRAAHNELFVQLPKKVLTWLALTPKKLEVEAEISEEELRIIYSVPRGEAHDQQ